MSYSLNVNGIKQKIVQRLCSMVSDAINISHYSQAETRKGDYNIFVNFVSIICSDAYYTSLRDRVYHITLFCYLCKSALPSSSSVGVIRRKRRSILFQTCSVCDRWWNAACKSMTVTPCCYMYKTSLRTLAVWHCALL